MNVIKALFYTVICLSMFSTSIASATVQCYMNGEEAPFEIRMDSEMEVPCHDTADNKDQNSNMCDECNCQHCLKTNALLMSQSDKNLSASIKKIHTKYLLTSKELESSVPPPKLLS